MEVDQQGSAVGEAPPWGVPQPGLALARLPRPRPRPVSARLDGDTLEAVQYELGMFRGYEIVVYDAEPGPTGPIRHAAIISRTTEPKANRLLQVRVDVLAPEEYRIRVFERLPLPLQLKVVHEGTVAFGDHTAIAQYFVQVLRHWQAVMGPPPQGKPLAPAARPSAAAGQPARRTTVPSRRA